MDDRTALFANALTDPTDDTARLVLADWLEENSESDLGRFLRGVVAARSLDETRTEDRDSQAARATLTEVAVSGAAARWLSELGIGPRPLTHGDWEWDNAAGNLTVRIGRTAGVFRRGLLTELEITLDEWYTVAAEALSRWPVGGVRVTDVPTLSFVIEPVSAGWRLTGHVREPQRHVPMSRHILASALGPQVTLTEAGGEWGADQFFADRAAPWRGSRESASLVDALRDAAGGPLAVPAQVARSA